MVNYKQKKQLFEVLTNFQNSFNELSKAWEQNQDLMIKIGAEDDYPFHKSFNELNYDVQDWIYYLKQELKENE